jgi:AraC-like DNA-binding protein
VLIPAIVAAVMVVSMSTPSSTEHNPLDVRPSMSDSLSEEADMQDRLASGSDEDKTQETVQIIAKFDALMTEQQIFQDPDLSLDRLARRLGIPARKISSAVNQTHKQNISKVINAYRIEHAKTLLQQSDKAITDIFLSSGFQTKSNFNREFSRITGQTPSEFRSSPQMSD